MSSFELVLSWFMTWLAPPGFCYVREMGDQSSLTRPFGEGFGRESKAILPILPQNLAGIMQAGALID